MSHWSLDLQKLLKNSHRIAVLGAGSELCGDDAAGMLVAHKLKEIADDQQSN